MSCVSSDDIHAAIEAKYQSLQNEGIDYGGQLGGLTFDWTKEDVYDSHHAFIQYTQGCICWGNDTGVHGVHKSFQQAWRDHINGLGYPIRTTRPTRNNQGYFTHFKEGSLVTSSGNMWPAICRDPRRAIPRKDQPRLLAYDSNNPVHPNTPYPWMLVMLPSSDHENMMFLGDPGEPRRTTDFAHHFVLLLLGVDRGIVEPITLGHGIHSDGSYLWVHVQVNVQKAYQTTIFYQPYWEIEMPFGYPGYYLGIPDELKLKIFYKEIPSYDGEIITY